jgi:LPS export ABC transporter protein LptC
VTMRVDPIRVVLVVLLAAACRAAGGEPPSGETDSKLQGGFTFNSTRKNGTIEWKIEGSAATFITPTDVELQDVRAVYFAEDGTTTVATTEKAVLNRETREVTTDKFVTIVTKNAVTTGTGFDWDQEHRKGAMKKDVKVIYSNPDRKELLR